VEGASDNEGAFSNFGGVTIDEEEFEEVEATILSQEASSNGELSIEFDNEFICPAELIPYFGENFFRRRL